MRKAYLGISILIAFLTVAVSGCGRNVSNFGDEISADLSTENNDPDEKYKYYLQEQIAEAVVQSTGCSSVHTGIEMSEDGTIVKVEIASGEYAFTEEEKKTVIQYIENLTGNPNAEVVFEGRSQNDVCLNSGNADPEYFNVSDIDYHEGNSAGEVRVMYLNRDEISDRENRFSTI